MALLRRAPVVVQVACLHRPACPPAGFKFEILSDKLIRRRVRRVFLSTALSRFVSSVDVVTDGLHPAIKQWRNCHIPFSLVVNHQSCNKFFLT